jgi:hypothetical protein
VDLDVSFEFTMTLRGREVLVQVRDYNILEDEGEDVLYFHFKVYDQDEDCEIMALTDQERELVFGKCMDEVLGICQED